MVIYREIESVLTAQDWLRACLREEKWISEQPFLIGKFLVHHQCLIFGLAFLKNYLHLKIQAKLFLFLRLPLQTYPP